MTDEWDQYEVGSEQSNNSTDDWESYSVKEPQVSNTNMASAIPGLALAAGVGYGVKKGLEKGLNWYNEPKLERNKLVNKALEIQKSIGQEGTRISELPRQLTDKTNALKQSLREIDNTILKTPVNKLSSLVQSGYQPFFNSAYNTYGEVLDSLDKSLESSGAKLTRDSFNKEVIDPILKKYDGVISDSKKANIASILGDDSIRGELSVSKAKNLIKKIADELPENNEHNLKVGWSKYLEKNAPPGLSEQYAELNKSYVPIANSRKAIGKYYNPATGEFDTAGLAKYFSGYAKSKYDTGVKELMNLFGKGNKLAKPMEGVTAAFSDLDSVKLNQVQKIVDDIKSWGTKAVEAKDLVSKIKVSQKRVDNRSIMNKLQSAPVIGSLGRLASKGLPILAGASDALRIFEMWKLRNDPEAQYIKAMGGDLAPKGTLDREAQLGRVI